MGADLDVIAILALIGAGLAAGFINTLAGGGSLLTLPALMLAGLPADVANGTNRLGIFLQASTALTRFRSQGLIHWRESVGVIFPTLLGALVGVLVAVYVPRDTLEPILLLTLVCVALLMALRPQLFDVSAATEQAQTRIAPTAQLKLFLAGVYAGFIQAGLGFVLLAILCGGLRFSLVKANAMKAAIVFVLTLAALGLFIAYDLMAWIPGLVIGVSGAMGAYLGVHFATRVEARTLRWFVLVTVTTACLVIAFR